MSARRVLPLLLVGAGCTAELEDLPLAGIPIAGARLEKWNVGSFGMIGGGLSGSAELRVDATNGATYEVPVTLGGGSVGWMIDVGADFGGTVELDLPPGRVTGDALFGTYRGSREGFVMVLGAYGHHVQNEAGVRIDATHFALGISILVAAEWLTILPDLPEPDATGDTGASTTGSGDTAGTSAPTTADTGDTLLPTTGDTGLPAPR